MYIAHGHHFCPVLINVFHQTTRCDVAFFSGGLTFYCAQVDSFTISLHSPDSRMPLGLCSPLLGMCKGTKAVRVNNRCVLIKCPGISRRSQNFFFFFFNEFMFNFQVSSKNFLKLDNAHKGTANGLWKTWKFLLVTWAHKSLQFVRMHWTLRYPQFIF